MMLEYLVIPASKEAFKDYAIHVKRTQKPIVEASTGKRWDNLNIIRDMCDGLEYMKYVQIQEFI